MMLEVFTRNLSYSLRGLRKNPAFALTAVLTLALGIGATTAMFSVVYAVFEPMPYPQPDQLVMVWSRAQGNRNSTVAGDFLDWKERSSSFQGMSAWTGGSFNVGTNDRPEQIVGSQRTPGFFTMEGMPLLLGRDFTPEEAQPGNDRVVILSHRLWVRSFNSNPNVVGTQIRMNGEAYTVVGVLRPGIYDRLNPQLWVPLSLGTDPTNRDSRWVSVMARLKEGVSLAQAQGEMKSIAGQIQTEHPRPHPIDVTVEPLHLNFVTDRTRQNLWLLLGAVGLLLLIGCVNVANLLFARGTSRQREVAVRSALGASRARVFSQLLTEALVLAALGGAVGICLALAITRFIESVMPPVGTMIPSEADIRISIPVLMFTLAVTGLAGVLFGSVPAWHATRLDLNAVLKVGGRSGASGTKQGVRSILVIAEFALALTLLAAGGLALRSFWNVSQIDLGIRPDNVLTFRLPVPEHRLKEPERMRSYYRQMLERIEAVPGVKSATVMTGVPAAGPGPSVRFSVVGQPTPGLAELPNAALHMVTAGYLNTLGVRLLKGRGVDMHDSETSPRVALVNEHFVNRFLASEVDPLSQRIALNESRQGTAQRSAAEYQIVGVFHNVRGAGPRPEYPEVIVPFWQDPRPRASIALKTDGDPKALLRSIAAAVNAVDPDMPLAGAKTVDEIIDESLAINRFSVVLFASFGSLGLVLAAIGIYGVTSFGVAERTREFGVCLALGAQRSRVMSAVLREGTALALIGGVFGLIGALLVRRAMQITLFDVPAIDVRVFATIFLLLLISAWLACLIPAWRASRVEPLHALRYD
jgi:putative ABC transport system permease protein